MGLVLAEDNKSDSSLETLGERVAQAERGVISVLELSSLLPSFARVVEAGLLSVASSKALKIKIKDSDLSELRYQDALRRSQRLLSEYPYMMAGFSLISLQDQQQYELAGRIERFYDLNFKSGSTQQFREKLQLTRPSELSNLAFLTIRSQDAGIEDFVWYRSAGASFSQELTQSVRDDIFLGTGITLNDFLGIASKVDLLELQSEDILLDVYVPVVYSDTDTTDTQAKYLSGCLEVVFPVQDFPISVTAVKRRLLRLSLLVSDPFSVIARHVIHLDSDTFRPVFQETYDRSDRLIRTQISILSPVTVDRQQFLLPTAAVFLSAQDQTAVRLAYEDFLFCSADSALTQAKEFDPSKLQAKSE